MKITTDLESRITEKINTISTLADQLPGVIIIHRKLNVSNSFELSQYVRAFDLI